MFFVYADLERLLLDSNNNDKNFDNKINDINYNNSKNKVYQKHVPFSVCYYLKRV